MTRWHDRSRLVLATVRMLAGLCLLIGVASPRPGYPNEAEESIKQLVVMVEAKRAGVEHLGSGIIFGMGPDRLYIVTADHVVRPRRQEPEEVYIRYRWGPDERVKAQLLESRDAALDVAVLSVSGLKDLASRYEGLPFDRLGDPDALRRGDALYLLGHPGGRPWRMNTSAERLVETRDHRLEFESNVIAVGHSGGALLNRMMDLVGMLRSDTPPYGEAVSISTILKKVSEWGYPVHLRRFSVRVSAGEHRTCYLGPDGLARCWGQVREDFDRRIDTQDLRFKTISVGGSHVCGIIPEGTAYCFGENGHGQLGDGSQFANYDEPMPVAAGSVFKSVSAGTGHTCGVTMEGRAYCWGLGRYGQLGDGTGKDSAVPVPVSGGLTFKSVSAGWLYTHGVAMDDILYYWGNLNDSGYLGSTLVPVRIADNFESVSAGMYHACGVRVGGAAYCWGIDEQGELGNGVAGESSQVPTPVSGELTFKFVSAGGYAHTCGITTTGATFCWGGNRHGQLGNGGTAKSPRPVPVSGNLTFASISAGLSQTCGVTTDGAIYCWGSNASGEVGLDKVESVANPTRVFSMP
jgi:hypothetical protein